MTRTRPARPTTVLSMTLLTALAAVASAPARQDVPEKDKAATKGKPTVVPFEMLASNHMVVKVMMNGEGPFEMIFDVGSPFTLLGNKAAEKAGVVDKDVPKIFLFGMRGEAKVDEFGVGGVTAKGLPVMVMDHPLLKLLGEALKRPIDGLVGYTFFARYKTTIDYQARTMAFEPVDFEVRDIMQDLAGRMLGSRRKAPSRRYLAPAGLWGFRAGPPPADEGVSSRGVPILDVAPGSPAAAAGLKPGDVLTTLDGRWTASVADVHAAAASVPPGQTAEAVVLRDGQELTLKITPREGL